MIEKRRVRFATIEGLTRDDLALAGEVWLEDLFAASWVSREAMKLGVHLIRYINNSDPASLHYKAIDTQCHMIRDDVDRALSLMRTFNAVDAFSMEKDDIRVAMNLTMLQRLRVLEVKDRLRLLTTEQMQCAETISAQPVKEDCWAPEPAREPAAGPARLEAEAPISPLVALIGEHIRVAAGERAKASRAA